MPKLGGFQTKRVSLPSYPKSDPGWVDISKDISLELWAAVQDQEGWEQTISMLASVINDWNLTGADGKKAPINKENISKLSARDLAAITEGLGFDKLAERAKLNKEEKKS